MEKEVPVRPTRQTMVILTQTMVILTQTMVILTQKQAKHQMDRADQKMLLYHKNNKADRLDLKIKQAKHQLEQMGRQEQSRPILLTRQDLQQPFLRNRVDLKLLLGHRQHKTISLLQVRPLEANPQRQFHQNSSNLP